MQSSSLAPIPSGDHIPEAKAEVSLRIDEDHIHCPLSLEIMRHPILVSDGRHYELTELLDSIKRYGLVSPVNREPLTYAVYDRGLEASLAKTFKDDERYKAYDRTADLLELENLFQRDQLRKLHEHEAHQEVKLQNIEQIQVRRQAEVLQQIRMRVAAPPVALPVHVIHINNMDDAQRMRQMDAACLDLLRRIPVRGIGRYFVIYLVTAMFIDEMYETSHSGPHDSSPEHMHDSINDSRAVPIGMLVATADAAIRYAGQNANGLFHRMRGVVSGYFSAWARPAEQVDDDFGPNHVRQHLL
jgi:hypothetical protein